MENKKKETFSTNFIKYNNINLRTNLVTELLSYTLLNSDRIFYSFTQLFIVGRLLLFTLSIDPS